MIKWLLFFPLIAFANEDIVEVSEAIGHLIDQNLDSFGLDFDLEAVLKGLKDENEGIASPLTQEEYQQAIVELQDEKIIETTEADLIQADCISNTPEFFNENYPLPASDSAEYR